MVLLELLLALSIMTHFWGRTAVFLGVWEGVAMLTRVPTISRTMWWLITRHPVCRLHRSHTSAYNVTTTHVVADWPYGTTRQSLRPPFGWP